MIEITIPNVDEIEKAVERNVPDLLKALEKEGLREANAFYTALYDDHESERDVLVDSKIEEKSVTIRAEGGSVLFMEYGAGIHYNGAEPHPDRPAEVDRIGEYGKGRGKQDSWYFKDDKGVHKTHGTPAHKPMYRAKQSIRKFASEKGAEILTK